LYRSLVFIDDKRRTKTVDFYKADKVHEHVREIYWQPSQDGHQDLGEPLARRRESSELLPSLHCEL
jgi:hypothetical protein